MKDTITINQTSVTVLKGDITKIEADAIVNAANTSLLGGGGVDGAIHRAGGKAILEECIKIRQKQGGCPVGEAVITTAGSLPASYVIHTVGPVWNGGQHDEPAKLESCYLRSLALASEYKLNRIAFPNISTGIYRFPKALAAEIAINTVLSYIRSLSAGDNRLDGILFVCFDDENYAIYRELLYSLQPMKE
ncbi:O-acetyl-ADP-ribose deacetylase [Paenibacillus sp. H1-7]|uniref:O-acetyl-ADP-ribose deacetylase n=1 Tax=Paenibacillus sp. H1-7 TaxID=2282849 RepID=UPI001EF97D68|nr:O-acetyl-ADP-ribose deacetylase [Paenibacillus sp. H1-7]